MNSFEIVATRYKEYQSYHSVIISIFLVGYSKKGKVKIKDTCEENRWTSSSFSVYPLYSES